jgi:hypothetical protein
MMNTITIKPGQIWIDVDQRNTDRGKTGKARPKFREIEILSVPTPSMPGAFRVVKAPRAVHTIGKVRKFTRAKLVANYALKAD